MEPVIPDLSCPVAVYTMGKVGSSSVTDALETAGLETLQVHVLGGGSKQIRRRSERRPNVGHLQSSVRTWDLIEADHALKIISLVRDPVSRNVSAFFQNFERLVGGDINELSVQEVQRLICEKVLPEEPQEWLEAELEGFALVELGRHRLFEGPTVAKEARWPTLLLRSDFDDEAKSVALNSFLPGMNITVGRSKNVTSAKEGGSLSSQIKTSGLPSSYVDACLAQPFVGTTWSSVEIESLRQRWTAS